MEFVAVQTTSPSQRRAKSSPAEAQQMGNTGLAVAVMWNKHTLMIVYLVLFQKTVKDYMSQKF